MKYADLNALLKADPKARKYFDALPKNVQEQINSRAQGINSLPSLQDYAENLIQGNG